MFLLQKEMPEKLQTIKTAWLDSGSWVQSDYGYIAGFVTNTAP